MKALPSGSSIINTATVDGTRSESVNGDTIISGNYDSTVSIFDKSIFRDYIEGFLNKSTYTIDGVEYTNNHLIWDVENFDINDTNHTYLVFKKGICLIEDSYNYKSDGSCIYEGCDDSQACNYNQNGSCERPPENYTCTGSWIGDYCGAASACNTGSRATCTWPDSDRVDCDGKPLYCTDPEACNYNDIGTCEYHGSRTDCEGNPLYCTNENAINYNEMGSCIPGTIENVFSGSLIKSGNIYTLISNFTIDDSNKHTFPIPIEDGITFDGGNKTITYTGSNNWVGLFKTTDNNKTFTIQNTIFNLQGAHLDSDNGCFLAKVEYDNNSITINNCHSKSDNSKNIRGNGGGIVGGYFGQGGATCTIKNCTNNIIIIGSYGRRYLRQ